MAAVWIADPVEVSLTEEERHRKAIELAERTLGAAEEIWPEIFASLTDNGKKLFVIDILQAQLDHPGDVDALARVGEAWWRTQQARASYAKNVKSKGRARAYGSAELRAALKLDEP
jgi:hypothetical protein